MDQYVLKLSAVLLLIVINTLMMGCSSIIDARKQKQPYIDTYYSGNVSLAAKDFTEKSEGRIDTGDELMWTLEAGTANYSASEYQSSMREFERSEALIQDFDRRAMINARAAGSEVGSALTNPNALPYQGMYLDRVMLNAYKALNYFTLYDLAGAQVELRRMREAQKQVVRKFADEIRTSQKEIDAQVQKNQQQSRSMGNQNTNISFATIVKNPAVNEAYRTSASKSNKLYGSLANPFVSYFSALGYLIDNNYAEALVDFRNLYRMNPNNQLVQRDYVSAANRIGSEIPIQLAKVQPYQYPLNNKIVYVVLFNGRAPALKQEKFQIILPYVGYTGIAFPRYEYFPALLPGLDIDYTYNKQQLSVRTEQVADFDAIMSQEYHDKLPSMITRLVISTLTKELASYAIVHAARQSGSSGAEIGAYALTGIYKFMFNTADTRGWETLPKEVQIAHVPMPDNGLLKIGAGGESKEIALKKDTNIAIIYIRALSPKNLLYKVIELQ
ncbi:TPR repeat-containing protein [methanotrophic bacterial endosymbiont of Bathymodiolus sp.]|nr:TPR repeat-containing protein [methanotrophic bacterial endosymbiont of Bathymodiolus sp.]